MVSKHVIVVEPVIIFSLRGAGNRYNPTRVLTMAGIESLPQEEFDHDAFPRFLGGCFCDSLGCDR
jgi:hypothetical protein